MKFWNILLALIVIGIVIMGIVSNSKKRSLFTQLQHLLANEQFDEFFELIDSKQAQLVFPEYNRQYFKLNAYLMHGDSAHARQLLEQLLTMKTSKAQRRDLVLKAFSIFTTEGDESRAATMLHEIEGWDEPQYDTIKSDSRRMFDISLKNSTAYIDEMERELATAAPARKGQLDLMLAMQYDTLGNASKRDAYLEEAARNAQAPQDK